jgi:hypothetical protein
MDDLENIDLSDLSRRLHRLFEHHPPQGYLRGKTALRNALEEELRCSELEAETLIDTLESRGFIQFEGSARDPSEVDTPWAISADAPL